MSPTSLNHQVEDLVYELHECYKHCTAIRANRHVGSRHGHLDRLEDSLEDSRSTIKAQYDSLRYTVGSRMDFGDETARQAMNSCIRAVQTEIKTKLYDIAYRSEIKEPGFSKILKSLKVIEESVMSNLTKLAQRLISSPESTIPASRPVPTTPAPRSVEVVLQPGEMVMPKELYEKLMRHMKNSWSEALTTDGRTMYVNAWEPQNMQLDRPDGFVRRLRRSDSWEEIERRPIRREEGVRFADGW
jgi:hypothetical protein